MKNNIYNFYIQKVYADAGIVLNYGKAYTNKTGEMINAVDFICTDKIKVSLGDKYAVSSKASSEKYRIFFYNKDNIYQGQREIKANDIIKIDSIYYDYIAFNFYKSKDTNTLYNFLLYSYEVEPIYKKLSKKYNLENGQQFFRQSLEGKIELHKCDYKLIYDSYIEEDFILYIEKRNIATDKFYKYFVGRFSKSDCKFDTYINKCEIKVSVLDNYNDVLDKMKNTHDLIKLNPALTRLTLHKRPSMQVYVRGANSISNFFGGTYYEDETNFSVNDHTRLLNEFYFSYILSGNEFRIVSANISDVNGIYAGTNGYYVNNNVKYACTFEKVDTFKYLVHIKRLSDSLILYTSTAPIDIKDPSLGDNNDEVNDKHISNISRLRFFEVSNPANTRCVMDNIFMYYIYRRLLCDILEVDDSGYIKPTYEIPADDISKYNSNYKRCIGLRGGYFFCTSRTVDTPTRFGINDYNKYFTNQFIPSYTGLGRPLPVSRNIWANASLWYVYDENYENFEWRMRKMYNIKDTYNIGDVIKVLLSQIDKSIYFEKNTICSEFLFSDYNPLFNVEGKWLQLRFLITQKTNILKGEYDNPAQKAETSFEEIMNFLKTSMKCYWFIDDNKVLRIEHLNWFLNGGSYTKSNEAVQFDLTKLKDKFNKKNINTYNAELSYDKSDLNSRYEFSFMDDSTELFSDMNIDVISNYIQKDKVESISLNSFSSDIDLMLLNPSSFSNDGFAFICAVPGGSYPMIPIVKVTLKDIDGEIYDASVQNWYASWLFLVNYYMYDMPASNIKYTSIVNGELFVKNVIKCLENEVNFISDEDPDTNKLIKTMYGEGKIKELSIDTETRNNKVTLSYTPR